MALRKVEDVHKPALREDEKAGYERVSDCEVCACTVRAQRSIPCWHRGQTCPESSQNALKFSHISTRGMLKMYIMVMQVQLPAVEQKQTEGDLLFFLLLFFIIKRAFRSGHNTL